MARAKGRRITKEGFPEMAVIRPNNPVEVTAFVRQNLPRQTVFILDASRPKRATHHVPSPPPLAGKKIIF